MPKGRKPIGDAPMAGAERSRRHRAKLAALGIATSSTERTRRYRDRLAAGHVPKQGRGRKPIGDVAMTNTERCRRWRERHPKARHCIECGAKITTRSYRLCSDKCRKERQKRQIGKWFRAKKRKRLSDVPCAGCGKPFFTSRYYDQSYCTLACSAKHKYDHGPLKKSRAKRRNCIMCHKEMLGGTKLCSEKCRAARRNQIARQYRAEGRYALKYSAKARSRILAAAPCEGCARPFFVSYANRHRARFCSRACAPHVPPKERTIICASCREAFIGRQACAKYCSLTCYYRADNERKRARNQDKLRANAAQGALSRGLTQIAAMKHRLIELDGGES